MFLNKKRGTNPGIYMDWLNVKRLHCCHSKMVKWLNQTEHTLWGSSRRDLQKDRMRLRELSPLSKGQSICVFQKKIKSKSKSQNRERMSWTLYNFSLHCIVSYEVCIYRISRQRLHASASLKNHVNCIDFQLLISNRVGWNDRPSRWVDLLLSHKGKPLGTSTLHLQRASHLHL